MAEPLVISYKKGIIEKARSITLDAKQYVNLDLNKLAIKYKRMAPIIISKRMRHLASEFDDVEIQKTLKGFIEELETSQQYKITAGEMRLIQISAVQSSGTIRAVLCAYVLYKYEGEPVCDLVMIDMTQKRTADWDALSAGGMALICAVSILSAMLASGFGTVLAAAGYSAVRNDIKSETPQENAEAFLLKIMEEYGFITLRQDNKIELLTG